jgi:hypothetical protein
MWYLFLFFVLVVPSLYGTYSYLTSQELHPLLAVVATIGMQFGGQVIEVWNAVWSIQGASLAEGFVIFLGASTSILRLLWYYYVWNWIADNTEPTVSNASKAFVGTLLLLMATGFAVLGDVYAVPAAPHLSGATHVLTNPDILTQPLAELLGQAASDPGTQEALNQTVNNSNITR